MSGNLQPSMVPVVTIDDISAELGRFVHDCVYLLLDLDGWLALEQELWADLVDRGVPRDQVASFAARLVAQALATIGEEHVARVDRDGAQPTKP